VVDPEATLCPQPDAVAAVAGDAERAPKAYAPIAATVSAIDHLRALDRVGECGVSSIGLSSVPKEYATRLRNLPRDGA
jgi:hypothetical protein